MNPELYLAQKKAWKFKRDAEASAWRTARAAIREGERPLVADGAAFSAWAVIVCMGGCMVILLTALIMGGIDYGIRN